jgi:hypothetical protein
MGEEKLTKAQRELLAEIDARIIPRMVAASPTRSQLSRMGLIEAHRHPMKGGYRNPPYRITDAGRLALQSGEKQ